MKTCKICGKTNAPKYGLSGNFYKCVCGYIGQHPRVIKPKKEKVVYENSCADDYLDWLSDQW